MAGRADVNRGLLVLLLLLVPTLAGCFGAAGVPLPLDRLQAVRGQLEEFDRLDRAELDVRLRALEDEAARLAEAKDRALRADLARKQLLIGYCWERRGDFADAQRKYEAAARSEYGSVAYFRTAQIAEHLLAEARSQAADPGASPGTRAEAAEIMKVQQGRAVKALERAANYPIHTRVLLRQPAVASLQPGSWRVADMRHEAHSRLDKYFQDDLSYRIFDFLFQALGGKKEYSYVLTILVIGVVAGVFALVLSIPQFRSMQAMQAIQPELKKLQEKYKGDKQQMARAQMELFREHKINPAMSCLPMLIQMPILIWVYYGIRHFVFRFENVQFLHVQSLADPDVIAVGGTLLPGPLLLFYGVSMFFSQKLLATPAATPEQQKQQKLMAYMMPVMLVIILKGLPAAFILYWLVQNILMTLPRHLVMKGTRAVATPALAAPPDAAPRQAEPETTPAATPPAAAMERLSQGRGGGAQKGKAKQQKAKKGKRKGKKGKRSGKGKRR
jgi:YidC/Oxa1 family membrane protein insertase